MNKYGKTSVISAAVALPAGLLSSLVTTWVLKSRNGSDINLSSELAYLNEILVAFAVGFSIFWLLSLVTGLVGRKKDINPSLAKLGLVLLTVISVLSISIVVVNYKTSQISSSENIQQLENLFEPAQQ